MARRNDLVNNNDVSKMQERNEMEKKSYLPFISGGAKRIKPNYYKNKRDKTYSSMYEEDNSKMNITPVPRGYNGQSPLSESRKLLHRNILSQTNSKRQLQVAEYQMFQTTDKRAESMYVAKRKQM